MELELTRTYFPDGTNGVMRHNGVFQCYTIELPWLNNEPQRSCIPEGKYRLTTRYSFQHNLHFIVLNVKERSLILVHPANDALKELQGCIAPVSKLTGHGKGIASRLALEKIKKLVKANADDDPIYLTIKS